MSKQEQAIGELEGFAWDSTEGADNNFFGINELTPVTENVEATNPEPNKDEEEPEDPADEDDEPFDFGANDAEDTPNDPAADEPNEDDDEPNNPKVEGSIYNDVYTDMSNNGIFEYMEIEDGAELTAEDFIELTKAEVEARVDAGINAWADESLDEDAKAFIQFKLKGGNTRDFLKTLAETPEVPEGDITNERYQEHLVTEQLKAEGKDEYEIEDQIDFLKSKGRLASYAKKAQEKIVAIKEQTKQAAIQRAAEEKEKAAKYEQEFKTSIAQTLNTEKDFYGLSITPTEKRRIESLLTKRDHQLPNGQVVTGMQKILGEVAKDPKKLIALTKVIESDFNFEQIIKKAKTEETKKIKSVLENRTRRTESGSSSGSRGSLSDKFF